MAKILKGDYVDMAELLRDNMKAERTCRRPRSQHMESAGTSGGGGRREVPDLFSWIQCFGMYAAVVTSSTPKKPSNSLRTKPRLYEKPGGVAGKAG